VKLSIDADTCISSGECCYNHPDLFQFGEDSVPVVHVAEVETEHQRVEALQAIEVCPSGAISLEP
jgi:ferredoxin